MSAGEAAVVSSTPAAATIGVVIAAHFSITGRWPQGKAARGAFVGAVFGAEEVDPPLEHDTWRLRSFEHADGRALLLLVLWRPPQHRGRRAPEYRASDLETGRKREEDRRRSHRIARNHRIGTAERRHDLREIGRDAIVSVSLAGRAGHQTKPCPRASRRPCVTLIRRGAPARRSRASRGRPRPRDRARAQPSGRRPGRRPRHAGASHRS